MKNNNICKIESGIEVFPSPKAHVVKGLRGRMKKTDASKPLDPRTAHPFRRLEVGQSFFVPRKRDDDLRCVQRRVSVRAAQMKNARVGVFATRQIEAKGVRVWRVQ